ncbi:MAG: inositol monophosphatase [Chitinophagales bacterium]|nr:inositol monophosphatase [Chitinophagales bacterium]
MKSLSPEYLINFTFQVLQKAGAIAMQKFGETHQQVEKESFRSIVTEADKEVETFITEKILRTFPGHGIIGEEAGSKMADAEYIWVIDPIDGTSYYARGMTNFAVSLALLHNNQVILGGVEIPYYRETFYAFTGMGAYRNRHRIRVSNVNKLEEATVTLSHSYLAMAKYHLQAQHVLQNSRAIRGGGACAQELCLLACGKIDAMAAAQQSSWDYLAGKLLVEEAGGKFLSTDGSTFQIRASLLHQADFIATNGLIVLPTL